jgi:uncharacterized protein (DUF305 family)
MEMTKGKMTVLAVLCMLLGGTSAALVEDSPSTQGYEAAMGKMHQGMMMGYSGDADIDFVRGMIPHHQGAIDMAKVELKYGKDLELRKLAEGIVAAQESEIEMMQTWLKAHGQ